MKKNCKYPYCEQCVLPDCEVNYPQKRSAYWKNPEASRQASRRYREKKRIEQGRKTMKEKQKERQDLIYRFIVSYTENHLYPPSTVDIQKELGFSSNSDVSRDLKRLEERGLLKVDKGSRTYTLIGYKLIKIS